MRPALAALPRAEAISTPPEMPLLDALRLTPRGLSTETRVSPAAARVVTTRRVGAAAAALDLTRAPAKEEPRTAVRVATLARAAIAIAIGDVSASDESERLTRLGCLGYPHRDTSSTSISLICILPRLYEEQLGKVSPFCD